MMKRIGGPTGPCGKRAQAMRRVCLYLAVVMGLALALVVGTASPALAEVNGKPRLEATILGSNEFVAGQEGTLQVSVLNTGTFQGDVADPNDSVMAFGYTTTAGAILAPPCTTAIGIKATLESPTSAIQAVSGPIGIGTLSRGQTIPQPLTLTIRAGKDAEAGEYSLDLELDYQYLDDVDWLNCPVEESPYYEPQFEFHWRQVTQTQKITVRIVGSYFSVTNVETNSINAGSTGSITATIENSGHGAASEVRAEIAPGNDLASVGNKVFLSDLRGGESKEAKFRVTVAPEAVAETAPLDIILHYKDEGGVARQAVINIAVPIGAAEDYFLAAVTQTKELWAGSTGTVTLTIDDNAAGNVQEVTAEIVPGEYFIPVDKASFLGDMKQGGTTTTQFKVSVSPDAIVKQSPLNIMVKYKDENNMARQTLVTLGVQLNTEPEFEIEPTRADSALAPGAKRTIEIPIKNVSDYTLYDTVLRINLADPFSTAPFSTNDDTAYVGTLQPGESGSAQFKITVDSDTLPKVYMLDVEVKYWDSSGDSYTSKPMVTTVDVQAPPRFSVKTIIIISVIAGIVGGVFYTKRRRMKLASHQ
jgi:hypothetical protein